MKPLCIDLFCGLGGWADGFLAEGYDVVGFDNGSTAPYAMGAKYPGWLVIQDVLTLHGSQFRNADVIVASPPCQNYSYLAMPWSRSKDPNNSKSAKALRRKWETEGPDNRLFDACFRIQREACEAAGRYIPLIVENVRGAQPWVGRSAWNYGSFHLWGDVPALMPINLKRAMKVPGFRFDGSGRSFQTASVEGMKANPDGTNHPTGSWFRIADSSQGDRGSKNNGGSWFNVAHNTTSGTGRNPVHELAGQKVPVYSDPRRNGGRGVHLTNPAENSEGLKIGGDWFSDPKSTCRRHGSRSNARRAASAQIAKIPFELASHIARVYKPKNRERAA